MTEVLTLSIQDVINIAKCTNDHAVKGLTYWKESGIIEQLPDGRYRPTEAGIIRFMQKNGGFA